MDFTNVNLATIDDAVLDNGSSPALSEDQRYALVNGDYETAVATLAAGNVFAIRKEWVRSRRALELRLYTNEDVSGKHSMRVSENGVDWTSLTVSRSTSAWGAASTGSSGTFGMSTNSWKTMIYKLANNYVPTNGYVRTLTSYFSRDAGGGNVNVKVVVLRVNGGRLDLVGTSNVQTVSTDVYNTAFTFTFSPPLKCLANDIIAYCCYMNGSAVILRHFGTSMPGGFLTPRRYIDQEITGSTLISNWTDSGSDPSGTIGQTATFYGKYCYGSIADGTYVKYAEAAKRVAWSERIADRARSWRKSIESAHRRGGGGAGGSDAGGPAGRPGR